jgi:hypothetical protein
MLAVIKDRKIYYPEFQVTKHDQGIKMSRLRCYRNFHFIALNEIGNLAIIHNLYNTFSAPIMNDRDMLMGINIDVMGALNTVWVRPTGKKKDRPQGGSDIVSVPFYSPVDVPVEDGEWNIISTSPNLHDCCAALLHYGLDVKDAIAKTLSLCGHPNGNSIVYLNISDVVKDIEKSYTEDGGLTDEETLFEFLRKPIRNLKEGK